LITSCESRLILVHIFFRYQGSNNGSRVYRGDELENAKGELPCHIVAMNPRCHPRTIELLRAHFPHSFSVAAENGLPVHYATQFSKDPDIIPALLAAGGGDYGTVNAARMPDGLTPLHLVASRSDLQEAVHKIYSLSESAQLAMVRHLVDFGADKTAAVLEGYRPEHLVHRDRPKVIVIALLD
jgi:ankyrin repeat protein